MEIRDKSQINEDICYILPKSVRNELSRPYGILFSSTIDLINFVTNFKRIIAVGDVVTKNLFDHGIVPFLTIVDGKTKRKKYMTLKAINSISITNEAGLIRLSSIKILEKILKSDANNSTFIMVDGEEDLLVIPVVIYGRDGDIVVYGQPNAGAVVLEITDIMKWRVKDIFSKFEVKKC
ncbi:DUF359 domain-containing protein [Acidianus sulfidivorans JP7]|uniref:GTP-dependent dephospho-CoA kinase n=1 Tax=Acidianus sulfidivorans JP7 TaxID=619593 RepID=A0A2U9IMF2_9CREN|nr:DUF359 domain-containing protein [Acidianus sulfidivorans]AWR97165.1 DUF359 domain-containing protein [Acidianus sulfidivorans JP7]